MEVFNLFIYSAIILIVFYLFYSARLKKKRAQKKIYLEKQWGKQKATDYYNFDAIAKYFLRRKSKAEAFHTLSSREIEDLDVHEVFKYINRTRSKIGEQYLYNRLLNIPTKEDRTTFIREQEFFVNQEECIEIQSVLERLSHPKIYQLEELINGEQIKKPKYYPIIVLITLTVLASLILAPKFPVMLFLLIPSYLVNLFFHYSNKSNLNIYMGAFGQLFSVYKIAKKLQSFLSVQQLNKNLHFLKTLRNLKLKSRFLDDGQLMNNEFGIAFWVILEQFKILFNYETLIFINLLDDLNKKHKDLDDLFNFIGSIDLHISLQSLKAGEPKTCIPDFHASKAIQTKHVYHPLLETPITNNLSLQAKSLLLTGSNMSGKTTFIRTIALNLVLGQTLNLCFAESFNAPYARLYTAIRISDDILSKTSYFKEEVNQLDHFIKMSRSSNPAIFVLDEIFKGTNTKERIASAYGVLKYINTPKHIVLVSTHDTELTELLANQNYDLYYFSENINQNQLTFDYKIKKGQLENGNAIRILELNNFPSEIIQDAHHQLTEQ